MNKKLRFAKNLVPLVMSGEKITTWRLWDDKSLSLDDILDLVDSETDKVFAKAKIIRVMEKPFGELTDEDKQGHEKFESDEEMYQIYTKYYGRNVNQKTLVKVIWFNLI